MDPVILAEPKREGPEPQRLLGGYRFSIDGNIGCGKSTVVEALQSRLGGRGLRVALEPVDQWTNHNGINYLNLSHKQTARYGYVFQNLVIASYDNVRRLENPDIMERGPRAATRIFSALNYESGFWTDAEYDYIARWGEHVMDSFMDSKMVFIYLKLDPEAAHERLRKRARPEEELIDLDFLERIHEKYESWFSREASPVEVIDATRTREEVLEQVWTIITRYCPHLEGLERE
ncbi:ORF5R [black bullhead herpesvirus]|uniref:ORF5L n=1 Tax=black bullhead herpesvirus TaxID=508441 RepID=A0A2H5AJK5_9VIRU|nr:ORF5L [black bullhead herpesvirus]YP_009447909.1 ORF5R [black bullhead herpesvirus]AUG72261.1 ORF5L [black bullhead herpesvirus]AUG72331.1 ORF5R [black bullhead herpesvirus]